VGSPADLSQWQLSPGVWNGERLFQAAKFVTEMEYQHIVFEEFARFVQPAVNVFSQYDTSVDPAIEAEFAHAVYRFGHSMLTETVARTNADGSPNDIGLIDAFLNPVGFLDGGSAGPLTADQAAGSIVQGMAGQRGNAIDEFVVEALRNNLLGLPLDLATLNMTRARSEGIPTLNAARRVFHAGSAGALNSSVRPYTSWIDFGLALRHPASLVNFVAAYGTHPTIVAATSAVDKRAAAKLIVDPANPLDPAIPPDAADFMNGTGAWANAGGVTITGLDDVDLWMGGLAEATPVFGGMLGTTFNFVFETQMQKLQDNDRFYYLARLAGLHLLEQVEGGSFAELAMRNTTAKDLPALAFTRPDWAFDIANQANPSGIVDDPATPYNETNLDGTSKLIRMPDGTIRLTGGGTTENHSIFAGTNGPDRLQGAEGDDSLWGNDGNDRLEGGAGNDHLLGGAGNDILTDSFGIDVLNGGDGNDVVSGGRGADVLLGGNGSDFVIHGDDPSESFGGLGNDFIAGGAGADAIQGNEGDDWIEGGGGADVMRGDNAAPFPVSAGGNDVLIGDGGDDLYAAEGGMDVLVGGPGLDRLDGGLGFDWVTYVRDPQPANADMLNTILAPPDPLNLADQFLFDEAVSGGPLNDVIRGDNGNGFGHELTHDNLALVGGLSTLLSSTGTLLPGTGATPAFDASGNILLGGPGSDLLEGRGGNDLIDGDAWLNVRLTAVDRTGNTIQANRMSDLQAAVLNGDIDPGTIRTVREILTTPGDTSCDTAVFSGGRSNYSITANANGTTTVSHLSLGVDGIDTLRNVERLKFADKFVVIGAPGTCLPNATGTVTISNTTPTEKQLLTATSAITDPDGFDPTKVVLSWQYQNASGSWATVATGSSFTPTNPQVGFPLRVVATYTDKIGIQEAVTGAATAAVINVNDAPTGAPVLSTTTPLVGVAVTASTSTIADADGLVGVTLHFQWQAGTADIPGATGSSFTPTAAQVGSPLRVVVSFTDNHGTPETVASAESSAVAAANAPVAQVVPASMDFGSQGAGTTSVAKTVTVTNTGTLDLVVSGVSLTGPNQGDFPVTNFCGTVAPGVACPITVAFRPSTGGPESATLNIAHNAAGSPSTVSLTGTGVVPPTTFSVPASLDFGKNTRVNTSLTKTVLVTNTGANPLFVTSATAAVPFATVTLGTCSAAVAVGRTCKLNVTFTPTARTAYAGTLTVVSSNATNSPRTVALTGTGK
jgi:Ca2+-binding RTX toxin-like protein